MSSTVTAQGRLFLVDAHAYLHRAYHALPPLRNSSGEPVGALYGFARMLLGLIKREKPEFIAVCFDTPGPTFRHKAYEPYKATRKETDEDLKSQLSLARPLVEGLGLSCVELEGFEADDLMATLAVRGRNGGLDVVLVTGDKDAMQLVGEHVRVLHEGKNLIFDAAKVSEKYGVNPGQIVDYLALIGDTSDNVPGVPGVGPVGAVKLLTRYGSLEAALKAAKSGDPELSAKLAQILRDNAEKARLSRGLIELNCEAPLDLGVLECKVKPAPPETLLATLRRFEFTSMIREMFPDAAASEPALPSGPGERQAPVDRSTFKPLEIPDAKVLELKAWLKAAASAKRVSLSIVRMPRMELLGESPWSLAVSLPDGRCAMAEEADAKVPALRKILEGGATKMGHDLKAAATELERAGLRLGGELFDTMLAAYCLNPSAKYDIATLANEYRAGTLPDEKGDPRGAGLWRARAVFPLADVLRERLAQEEVRELFEDLEMPVLSVLAEMEARGVAVDADYLERLGAEFEGKIAELQKDINKMAGGEINLNSPKQLAKLLFEDLKLNVIKKTPKGDPSTDEETLIALRALHPLPAKIMDFRELSKLCSTYIHGLLERLDSRTGRVHTHFNQTGTATGRLSSVDPNLQNIPIRTPMGQKIRRAFVASPGRVLLSADYSQIDLRVLAHLSEDPALVEAFNSGEDVHLRTACEIFNVTRDQVDAEMRRRAKAVNFGIVYGQTAHGLGQTLGIPFGKAKEYIDRYFARCAGVKRWSAETLEAARRDGCVRTIKGRVRWLPDITAKNTAVRQFNERVAVNTPIQGSSADIIKVAMIDIRRAMDAAPDKWGARPVLQVHDELVFEVPKAEAHAFAKWVCKTMESAVRLKVPLVVDAKIGDNWQDMEKLK